MLAMIGDNLHFHFAFFEIAAFKLLELAESGPIDRVVFLVRWFSQFLKTLFCLVFVARLNLTLAAGVSRGRQRVLLRVDQGWFSQPLVNLDLALALQLLDWLHLLFKLLLDLDLLKLVQVSVYRLLCLRKCHVVWVIVCILLRLFNLLPLLLHEQAYQLLQIEALHQG